jgi:polyvinyl alcohol dehydrogenase (cytochrome)
MFSWFRKVKFGKVLAISLMSALLALPLSAASTPTASWVFSGQNIANWHSQPLETTINNTNANNLTPLFTVPTGGDVTATPAVYDGSVYFPDWAGNLYSVDAVTGVVNWSVNLSTLTGIPGMISRSTPAVQGNSLIVGTLTNGWLLSINRKKGTLQWKSQLDTHPAAVLTQSPVVYNNMIYIGVSSQEEFFAVDPNYSCCTFRGSILEVNLNSGAIMWKTYTAPDNGGQPGGYSGNAVWGSTPVVDPSRHLIFIGTGNNYTVPASVTADPTTVDPTNYTDSVLALNMASGKVVWADPFMGLTSDTWNLACFIPPYDNCPPSAGPDYDFGQGPMELKATIGGKSVDILGIGQKSGTFWGINPDNGKVLWSTVGGPGSALGGMEWGSATDGTRIYYAISNQYGIPYTMMNGQTTTGGLWGAIDPATGAILWQTADPNGAMDQGAVSVANGVVYAGSMGNVYGQATDSAKTNPTFFALDAATGTILWNYVSGGSVNSGAAIANGVVYWGSGYGRLSLGYPNNKFFAFNIK